MTKNNKNKCFESVRLTLNNLIYFSQIKIHIVIYIVIGMHVVRSYKFKKLSITVFVFYYFSLLHFLNLLCI